ncbi:hypothetical protein FACS1894167_00780 [Synergistales bacterium]|nr:hypothetical protein FACS1894167_00780 [Synergistales bacterium]
MNMYGTWREMGRQYGALASDILSETYKIAVEENILQGPYAPREAAEKAAGVVVLHKHGIDTVFVLQRPCRVTFGVVAPVILRPESTTR